MTWLLCRCHKWKDGVLKFKKDSKWYRLTVTISQLRFGIKKGELFRVMRVEGKYGFHVNLILDSFDS